MGHRGSLPVCINLRTCSWLPGWAPVSPATPASAQPAPVLIRGQEMVVSLCFAAVSLLKRKTNQNKTRRKA